MGGSGCRRRRSHAKPFSIRGRHRHYSAGDALMIRYLAILLYLLSFLSCSYELETESSCLKEGTKILTPQGDKLIETLSIGDKVISYDGTNKITNQITAIKKSKAKKTLKITLKNGITIEGTKEHPFFNVERQSYIKLSKLKQGDSLQLINGGSNEIVLIEKKKHPISIDIYDLSVKPPFHNYFAEGVLVHNKSPLLTFKLIITLNDGNQRISFLYIEGIGENMIYYLSNNANLSNAYLSDANLSDANLSNANLSSANLSDANLSSANLSNANLSNANLSSANLSSANLSDANLSSANLENVRLVGADLRNVNLRNVSFNGADLQLADLRNVNLFGANLSEANLSEANLSEANLSEANLSEANLSEANLSSANLTNTTLNSVNLSNANLSNANLSNANLSGLFRFDRSNLKFVNLSGANLINANLDRADLSGADLSYANLSNAILHNTYTNGIILTGAVGIDSNTFIGASP